MDFKKHRDKLDAKYSKYVRERDNWRCITPNHQCSDVIQCGHLIKRGKIWTRYDDDNCYAQCSTHNFMHNQYPEIMTEAVIMRIGEQKYLDLVKRSKNLQRFARAELEQVEEYLDIKIMELADCKRLEGQSADIHP